MAYDKQDIFEKAKSEIVLKRLIFVDEIPTFLPCSRSTFYDMFPDGSDELDELKKLIQNNKISLKTSMRKKWYDSDNATLQMGLMKLIATPEEHKRLQQSYIESDNKHEVKEFTVKIVDGSTNEQSI